jgi:hypothetical protein
MTLPADGVITVNGHEFAVGLVWGTEPTDSKLAQAARRAAREIAGDTEIGMRGDLYCLRPPIPGQQMPQYGIGFRAIGHRAKIPAAAAVLAASLATVPEPPQSWVGVFRTPEGRFWFVNVNDEGAILTETVFEHEDAAKQHLEEAMTLGYDVVYAPAPWGMGTTLRLRDLLQGDTPRLVVVSSRPTIILTAFAVSAIALAAYAGWSVWQSHIQDQRAAEQDTLRRQAEQAGLKGPVVPLMIPPWYKEPTVGGLLATCAHSLRDLMVPLPGWAITEGTCTSAALSISWHRDGGVVWWAAQVAQKTWPDAILKVGNQGDEASLTLALATAEPRGEEAIWPGGQAVRALWSIGQVLGRDITISQAVPDTPPSLPGSTKTPEAKPPWNAFHFKVSTARSPNELTYLFTQIPGLAFTSIGFSATGVWTYKGTLYEAV